MSEPRWLTHGLFAPHVGSPFELVDVGVVLVLAEAREHELAGGAGPDGATRRQFSLCFTGPVDAVLPQGTYALRHDVLGELELFLVPLGPRDGATRFEAAFA